MCYNKFLIGQSHISKSFWMFKMFDFFIIIIQLKAILFFSDHKNSFFGVGFGFNTNMHRLQLAWNVQFSFNRSVQKSRLMCTVMWTNVYTQWIEFNRIACVICKRQSKVNWKDSWCTLVKWLQSKIDWTTAYARLTLN